MEMFRPIQMVRTAAKNIYWGLWVLFQIFNIFNCVCSLSIIPNKRVCEHLSPLYLISDECFILHLADCNLFVYSVISYWFSQFHSLFHYCTLRHAEANLSPRNFELEISKKGIQCVILKLKILGQWEECPKGQKLFGLCPTGIKKNPKTLESKDVYGAWQCS